jgi:hypothetical protein
MLDIAVTRCADAASASEVLRRNPITGIAGCCPDARPRAADSRRRPEQGTHAVSFRQGLKEAGFVQGQNVAIEYRSAEDHLNRLPALVTELIHRPVAVIVGNHNAALAASPQPRRSPSSS